ncbi:MAG: hypothetical protein FWG25_07685 [Promicromonosporaceae bacterium]|nr:hypothetical protein [Promicromonosporaceae bacterium]
MAKFEVAQGLKLRFREIRERGLGDFVRRYIKDSPFRSMVNLYFGLGYDLAFAALRITSAVLLGSFWDGADGLYLAALTAARFALVKHYQKGDESPEMEWRGYRRCGWLLLLLNIAFIVVIYQVVHHNYGRDYPGIIIYLVAFYAFTRLAFAVNTAIRRRTHDSPTLKAAATLNLAKALVAIYALQTSLLRSFGTTEADQLLSDWASIITGGAISLFIVSFAVVMIRRSTREIAFAQTSQPPNIQPPQTA